MPVSRTQAARSPPALTIVPSKPTHSKRTLMAMAWVTIAIPVLPVSIALMLMLME